MHFLAEIKSQKDRIDLVNGEFRDKKTETSTPLVLSAQLILSDSSKQTAENIKSTYCLMSSLIENGASSLGLLDQYPLLGNWTAPDCNFKALLTMKSGFSFCDSDRSR